MHDAEIRGLFESFFDFDIIEPMDEDQLNDLKQFIANTVSQTEVRLTGRLDGLEGRINGLEGRLVRLEQKVDDGFAGVAEAIEQRIDDRDKEVDQRFTNLEGQIATQGV